MTQPRHGPASLDLSRSEAWTLHAAVVRLIERRLAAGDDSATAEFLREAIEAGEPLDAEQFDLAERALDAYLEEAPESDRSHARSALDDVRTAGRDDPSTSA